MANFGRKELAAKFEDRYPSKGELLMFLVQNPHSTSHEVAEAFKCNPRYYKERVRPADHVEKQLRTLLAEHRVVRRDIPLDRKRREDKSTFEYSLPASSTTLESFQEKTAEKTELPKEVASMRLAEIRKLVFEEYKKNGYEEMWNNPIKEQKIRHQALASCINNLEALSLLMEGIRKGEPYPKDFVIREFLSNDEVSSMAEGILIVTEVFELVDAIWKEEGVGEEMADIFIRLSNMATRLGIDLEEAILKKHEKNMKREKLHGKVI